MNEELTHINDKGEAKMVDVSPKDDTVREAFVTGGVRMKPETLDKIKQNQMKKGDVLAAARIAGILGAKKTPDLIPLCHTILVSEITIDFEFIGEDYIEIKTMAKSTGKTGVEMEAMTAAAVSALTIYDMCKAIDRGMSIENICLQKKSGGKSGTYIKP
ncbi:MAG: cyclic pyranopterin monophosphate synthase MoaC [Dehalococcoidales bacterium]|jgi:cyclic pyranopterin phosphate synthase|nr:cyclic pyranopterin monophosphate synthase MoaC [Dehalococcoidales bacterium]MDD3994366.1 cyclic pyranopterin monophosphate synthase MoaC [Dehalococcoidales bacterium]NLT28457.1 cyclic pyranopterin monophosphate synthase MoaC [Dehalococcoidales bacterium]